MTKEVRITYPNPGIYINIENMQSANFRKSKDSVFISNNHEKLQKIANECFKKSGVKVAVSRGGFGFSPEIDNGVTSSNVESNSKLLAEVFDKLRNNIGDLNAADAAAWILSLTEDEKKFLKSFIKNKNKGGIGITGRSLDQIKETIPQFFTYLKNKKFKKFVSLGNGFSSLPLELIEENNINVDKIVVSDLFSYKVFFEELRLYINKLNQTFDSDPQFIIPYVLEYYHDLIERMIEESNNSDGKITLSDPHFLGNDKDLPADMTNSDVVLNYMGAPQNTLNEQVKMLGNKGVLFIVVKGKVESDNIPDGYKVSYLDNFANEFAEPIPDTSLQLVKITNSL
ncbi:MAG: hypothetical protein GW942_02460 [Candidatus Pacebacteria bacterium]|nr:hypothetical protein [Candidatus Paceibacterota bacterium]